MVQVEQAAIEMADTEPGPGPCREPSREIERYLDKIAARLRSWRAAEAMTLQQVATRSGVAASTIQKVESQQMVPTIAVLFKIARGLGRSPVELIDDATGMPEVYHQSRDPEQDGGRPLRLSGELADTQLSTWRIREEPGEGADAGQLGPRGEILILCERGRLEARVGDRIYVLEPGDSLHCKTRQGLSWRATGAGPADFMLIGTEALALERVLTPGSMQSA